MKRILSLVLTSFAGASLVAAGCGNGSLLAPSSSENGETGTLNLSAIHHLHDGSALAANASGAKTVVNDLGFQVTLTHASLGYRSLALISSGDDPECVGGNDVTIDINGSDDLLGEDLVETSLGAHAIPLASFCSYTLTLGPSEEESAALKFHAGEDHEGDGGEVHGVHATLHLQGTWSKDGGEETEFEIELEETVEVTGVFEHPLHFHEGETETAEVFGVKYDILFDGIDFETDMIDAQYSKATENLEHAAHIHDSSSASH
jgi:hypothetical protein